MRILNQKENRKKQLEDNDKIIHVEACDSNFDDDDDFLTVHSNSVIRSRIKTLRSELNRIDVSKLENLTLHWSFNNKYLSFLDKKQQASSLQHK